MQREVTVSKFRPGLNIKDFSFIQCIAFHDVWVMLWDIICHSCIKKGLKPEKWNKKKKKEEE